MSRLWYIYQDNLQKGPFTQEEMNHYISSAGIKPHDLVWSEGMAEWVRVDQIHDFYTAIREAPGQADYFEEPPAPEQAAPVSPQSEPSTPEPDLVNDSAEVIDARKTIPNKSKSLIPIVAAVLAVVLIGGGFLVFNLITDRSEDQAAEIIGEAPEEETAEASEDEKEDNGLAVAAGEDYLIAFTSDYLGPFDLFVIDSLGQNMVRLTESEYLDLVLSWSPDGTSIVFDRYREDDYLHNIYMLELDSGNLTSLHEPQSNFFEPAWSPDGSQIVCVGDPEGGYTTELWLIDPDGGNMTQLTDLGMFILSPDWSPDGNKFVFTAYDDTFVDCELYVIDTNGENLTRLTDSGGTKSNPAWSPDGTKIVFSYDGNGLHDYDEIYIVDSDGSNETRLTESDLFSRYPTWSPDGSKIVYSQSQRLPWSSGNFPALYVMDPDGSNKTRITEGLSFEERAVWSPLKLDLNDLGEVIARDALDPDVLLGEWQGDYFGTSIEYSFSADEMEYNAPGVSNTVEYRVIPYFSVLNLEFNNTLSEQWEGYGQVQIIDQDTIIIRDFYLFDSLGYDDMEFYIEVTCVRVGSD